MGTDLFSDPHQAINRQPWSPCTAQSNEPASKDAVRITVSDDVEIGKEWSVDHPLSKVATEPVHQEGRRAVVESIPINQQFARKDSKPTHRLLVRRIQ